MGDLTARALNLALCVAMAASAPISRSGLRDRDAIGADAALGSMGSIRAAGSLPETRGFQPSAAPQLWVDAASGSDANDGLTPATPFRSIQKAADIASPGTTVHVMPGIYRESVRPAQSGTPSQPIVYQAENGPGTVRLRGSDRADSVTWSRLAANSIGLPASVDPADIYYADLSAWGLDQTPRFVVRLGSDGETVTRLPLSREPDWQVVTEWKYGEFWWAADGGADVPGCDPAANKNHDCDQSTRSMLQLIDRTSDLQPAGIEPGNLTTLGDLTGATLVALDTDEGHYVYRRTIVAHDVAAGKISVDKPCEFDSGSGEPGLGWGSKYYIENHPALLDTPGEWWYDAGMSRIYLWPPNPGSPDTQNIEVSRRTNGFDLSNRSYITLDGLSIELYNEATIVENNSSTDKSYGNTVRNATLRFADVGLDLGQGADGSASDITNGFTLEDSDVEQMDSRAIRLNYWWSGGTADSFTHVGIVNTVIRNNDLHDLGFRAEGDNGLGNLFNHADTLRFEGNYVHHVAQNGVAISRSVVQSDRDRGLAPSEIKTGTILIKDNLFEQACLLEADCGELKIQGNAPDNHVFRDLLITGNVFRNTFGWTYVSEKRGRWSGGEGSAVQGMGGFGLYVDNASGVQVYRNVAYNNAFSAFHLYQDWWDGDIVYYNNIAANSVHGIYLGGDTQGSINTQIANNIIINSEAYGILIYQPPGGYGNFVLDHNLYYDNGWRASPLWHPSRPGDMGGYHPDFYYQTLAAIRAHTGWEDHGVEGDPGFSKYNAADHDPFDGSWPDFHLAPDSANALNQGTSTLPASLQRLLNVFGVSDFMGGQAYEIGRYEEGFGLALSSTGELVSPCSVARFSLRSDSPDMPYDVTLAVTSPSPFLNVHLSSPHLSPHEVVILTVSESLMGGLLLPQVPYTIPITAIGEGFTAKANVRILVGGIRACIPISLQDLLVGAKGSG